MTITHHPDLASLLFCAAGSQPEARAAVMASHLAVCPACRAEAGRMERVGAAMFAILDPAPMARTAPVAALRAGEADVAEAGTGRGQCVETDGDVPGPLVPLVGTRLDDVPWRWMAPGVWSHKLPLSPASAGELRLFKIAPGVALPEHGHDGQELTLILRGSYADSTGTYRVGDVADLDADTAHNPVACPVEGCICLAATEGALRFKGMLPRLLRPLMGL
jgi:putative transcriptional regulator